MRDDGRLNGSTFLAAVFLQRGDSWKRRTSLPEAVLAFQIEADV